jgi:hypothetical protein
MVAQSCPMGGPPQTTVITSTFLPTVQQGPFFLGSVDASSEVANANMLADLLEQQINKTSKENVVQVVRQWSKFQGSRTNPYGQDPIAWI